eukprot:CAMPEP_0114233998 /NCGR_PEP_ID=MMETSP0058-20121206/5479_1 /TAXON_ID=36894 /ORGANISM="Pyramimonas parkeae, CCMP726" /LENGTH=536 /DNA_ID=CAMNT_0001345657 /DNA_START=56 /DNA_END=1666 /DNA_ORIENTATION=-
MAAGHNPRAPTGGACKNRGGAGTTTVSHAQGVQPRSSRNAKFIPSRVSRRSHMCPSSLVTRADRKRQSSLVVARAGSDERVESKGAQGEDKSNSSPQPEKNPQEQEACDDSETPKEKALDSLFEDPKKNPLNLPVEELLSKIQNDAPVLNVDSILRVVIERAGIPGTVAVLAGLVCQVNPLGTLHFDVDHLVLGLLAMAPITLMDMTLMVPDHAGYVQQNKDDSPDWRKSAARYQADSVRLNPCGELPYPAEVGVILVCGLAHGMVRWGAGLGIASKCAQNYLENVQRMDAAASAELAPVLALALIVLLQAAKEYRTLTVPVYVKAAKMEKDKVTGKMKAKNIDADNIKEDNMDAEQIRDLRNRLQSAKSTRMFMVSIDSSRALLDWICYGGVFLATGNLLSPVVAYTANEMTYSALQRLNAARLRKRRTEGLRAMMENLKEKFPDGRRTVNLGEMVEAMIGDDDEHDASVKARATDIDKSVAQKPQGSTELPASRKDGEEISDKANPGNIPEHTEVKVVKEKATSAASTRSDSEA